MFYSVRGSTGGTNVPGAAPHFLASLCCLASYVTVPPSSGSNHCPPSIPSKKQSTAYRIAGVVIVITRSPLCCSSQVANFQTRCCTSEFRLW